MSSAIVEPLLYEGYDEGSYLMAFVVNGELGMGTGKVASQVAHAALGMYRLLTDQTRETQKSSLGHWEQVNGEKIAIFKGESTQHLLSLMTEAQEKGLESYIFCDDGLTQIAPGSKTVLSIFGKEEGISQVTTKLKIL